MKVKIKFTDNVTIIYKNVKKLEIENLTKKGIYHLVLFFEESRALYVPLSKIKKYKIYDYNVKAKIEQ